MAHHLGRVIHSHQQLKGMDGQHKSHTMRVLLIDISVLNSSKIDDARDGIKDQFVLNDANVSSNIEYSRRSTSQNFLGNAEIVPKILMFQPGISFLEFKRCCGEKLGLPCTRVFLFEGGEIELVSHLQNNDLIICTSGSTFQPLNLRLFFASSEKQYNDLHGKQTSSFYTSLMNGPSSSSLHASADLSAKKSYSNPQTKSLSAFSSDRSERKKLGAGLSRFRDAVHRIQKRNNESKVKTLKKGSNSAPSLTIGNSTKIGMADAVLAMTAAMKSKSREELQQELGKDEAQGNTMGLKSKRSSNSDAPLGKIEPIRKNSTSAVLPKSATSLHNYNTSSMLERASWNGRRRSDVWDMKAINRKGEKIQASSIRGEAHKKAQCRQIIVQYCCRLCILSWGSCLATWACLGRRNRSPQSSSSREPDPSNCDVDCLPNNDIHAKKEEFETLCSVFSLPIYYPDNTYRALWDCILTLLVIYYSLAVPLRMAFDLASPTEIENLFDIIFSFLFILDIGLNFCTAIKLHGTTVTEHKTIAQHYLRSWFLVDFISSIPVDLIFLNTDRENSPNTDAYEINKLFKMLRIFKLLRVLRLQRIINRLETHHHVNPSVLRMGKLIGILVSTWHWIACCYWGVALLGHGTTSSRYGEDTWSPPPYVAQANDLVTQYSYAFFWAVVVTSGIGWDIIPTSPVQVIFTTVAIVTGLLIYAIIIGSASSLLASLDTAESDRRSKMQEIKYLMRNRHVPKKLSAEIYDFYEYFLSCNSRAIDEYSVLSDLPQSLRSRLNIAINRQIIKNIPLFKDCTDAEMAALIEQLYQLVILPGEYVMEQGSVGHEMYFVVRGKLQVLRDTDAGYRIMLANRGEGDFFGEIALFEDTYRSASVKAISYCDLLTLPREGFEFIQLHFPNISATLARAARRRKKTIDEVIDIENLGTGLEHDDSKSTEENKQEYSESQTKIVPRKLNDNGPTDSWKFRDKILNVDDESFKPLVLDKTERI